jgi:hypothetical protein
MTYTMIGTPQYFAPEDLLDKYIGIHVLHVNKY